MTALSWKRVGKWMCKSKEASRSIIFNNKLLIHSANVYTFVITQPWTNIATHPPSQQEDGWASVYRKLAICETMRSLSSTRMKEDHFSLAINLCGTCVVVSYKFKIGSFISTLDRCIFKAVLLVAMHNTWTRYRCTTLTIIIKVFCLHILENLDLQLGCMCCRDAMSSITF